MIKKKITTETKQRIFTLRSEGLTVKEISEKYNISKSTIYSILAGRYDSHLSKLSEYRNRRNYRASPFQILDIIGNMREATISDIIIELECHYREQKSKYESVLRTLKQLVDDEIIIRAGKGGKWGPYRYTLNPNHPAYDMLCAMTNGKFEELSDKLDTYE